MRYFIGAGYIDIDGNGGRTWCDYSANVIRGQWWEFCRVNAIDDNDTNLKLYLNTIGLRGIK